MQPLQFVVPLLDLLEALEGFLIYVVLVLVLANMVTRILAHNRHEKQAEDEDSDLSRYAPHTATNVLLILATMLYLVVEPHSGMVTAMLVLGVFLSDFFEFESRRVEVRTNRSLERPKASIAGSVLTLLYVAYVGLFFLVKDYWNMVI
jgi:hypothetical protein